MGYRMHELSVALSLLEEVDAAARRENATNVASVRLRIGRLSGGARDALLFAWDLARVDSVASNAELHIEDVDVAVYCPNCKCERAPLCGAGFTCGTCGTLTSTIVRGRELELVAMEVAA
jgi:hydrogenase nickel incorporation protein HypA/HybF